MDPISQGALGAVAALTVSKNENTRLAALCGAVGGMLADADIFIRSETDPLLNIEYHRHFSHSLLFIPIGGLVASFVLYFLLRKHTQPVQLYTYCTVGYATAGLLDACTSYGTQLLWPFSDLRVSWSLISIVDPLFTLPILVLLIFALIKKRAQLGQVAFAFSLCYLSLGLIQNKRAHAHLIELTEKRGHDSAIRLSVKPSIANLILWRSVYLHEGHYYIDAIHAGFPGNAKAYTGDSLPAFDLEAHLKSLPPESPLAHDLKRFDHFSEGYLAALPKEPDFLTDLRYSMIPHSIAPLWGLDLSKINEAGHAAFENRRNITEEDKQAFLRMLKGE